MILMRTIVHTSEDNSLQLCGEFLRPKKAGIKEFNHIPEVLLYNGTLNKIF
jgi:hypothetical protein